ncbi:amidohydrolase [Patiriisocius hiemis]|uniref:Amidohydrolase n=1 Tax=Patiriisocius hiemis TaxID=3075604 RepID=A0ABU2YFQ3_9FLAO|nr:amidohydrolase [Constantimarinum sp. W242]MDT0556706.1 amidohydrolase [Constantimarinum sp. W242]
MKNFAFLLISMLFVSACTDTKETTDLLVTNAKVYTVNENFDITEAFVITDGKIVAVGTEEVLLKKYNPSKTLDAKGKTILPGLIDAHAHLFNLGVTLQQVDLVGSASYQEVLDRVVAFQEKKNTNYIIGRGWDQNDWEVKEFPTKEELDKLFPDTPVALTRIDGHAMIVNSKALALANISPQTQVPGGEVEVANGELTGILIDAPMGLVRATIPEMNQTTRVQALQDAEAICVSLGLTTINDAGLSQNVIEAIDSLQQKGVMDIRVYAMISNTPKNLDYYLDKGIIKTDRLNVRSVKVYADGALGSRGAAMKAPYSDKENHFGAMITPQSELQSLASRISKAGYQMNTHAIGDSANVAVLRAYKEALKDREDSRWKVEHAQIIDTKDFNYFSKNIIPSVQPTHATSDMYWAEDRVGEDRIKGAYSYKTLLDQAGIIALGTDFPVEKVNPMHTFYAAVARKDLENYPEGGFRKEEGLSREETLRGMTIWAAYSNFEENEKGSIEVGKFADFIILDKNIMEVDEDSIPNIKVLSTYINGEEVFSAIE